MRFVAPYDNVVLAHAERGRVVPERYHPKLLSKNGIVPGTVLVDGFVSGVWGRDRRRGERPRLGMRLFRRRDARVERQLRREADRLAAFAGGEPELVIDSACGLTATTR